VNYRLYSFAHLGGVDCGVVRLRGVGLANCLFPWARCMVSSKKLNLVRIASTWPQLCHRQWLRRDRDKRWYARLFDESGGTVSGARKLLLLSSSVRISEHDFLRDPDRYQKGIVVFSGIDGYFAEFLDEHALVKDGLLTSARSTHKAVLGRMPSRGINVHVRLGDFISREREEPDGVGCLHVRQPIGWYIEVVQKLRQNIAPGIPVTIFSDGSNEELRPLLALPNVRRAWFGSSLGDLLALSAANVMIASGSTFSMWAAYLGRMPVIWPMGQRRQRLHGTDWEYEPEIGSEPVPESVIALIRRRLYE